MILVIDNYDSFVYNLARHMELAGWETSVVRNDKITIAEIEKLNPQAIVMSPGPCTPKEAGICVETVQHFGPKIPMLGVCLGHQCIGTAYGASMLRADKPVHGKASQIHHYGDALFDGLPNPFKAGRYHSLIIDEKSDLVTIARTGEGEVMAVKHHEFPTYGVQFHPESVLTEHGMDIIHNFTKIALGWKARKIAA